MKQNTFLCAFSDHVCRGLGHITAHEFLLDHQDSTFFELVGKINEAGRIYVSKDESITEPHRTGSLVSMIIVRGDKINESHSKLDRLIYQKDNVH